MKTLYQLNETLIFDRPRSWKFRARHAMLAREKHTIIEKGAWLLDLGSQLTAGDEKTEYLYRLASGEVVARGQPLSIADDGEAQLVTNKQAIIAMNAFRTLEQAAVEDWGIQIEHIDHLSPFRLIKCPLCGQSKFGSLDFSSAWCDGCNAQFQVRYTAGDPGFVVDCTWQNYHYGSSRLLLPRSDYLGMYLVFKNSGDPLDISCVDCDCDPETPNLTGQDDLSLRPGLHTCQVGDVYEWQLSGWIPNYTELNRQISQHGGWEVDGQRWPDCAYIRTASLLDGEFDALRQVLRHLSRLAKADDLAVLNDLKILNQNLSSHLPRKPMVCGALGGGGFTPDLTQLKQDERYLLHHWLVTKSEQIEFAWPVWYVVKPVQEAKQQGYSELDPIEGWEVIHKNLCPRCLKPVTEQDLAANALNARQGKTSDRSPHQHCRKLWAEGGWHPYEEALEAARR